MYEHRRDIRISNLSNVLLQHVSKTDHNFDFNAATMLACIHNKRSRQILEASVILLSRSVYNLPDFFNIFFLENLS